jgi:uncharacterized protein (DUF58 family)
MTIPGRLAFVGGIAVALLLMGAGVASVLVWIAVAFNIAIAVAMLIQARRLRRIRVHVERRDWQRGHIHRSRNFIYVIENRSDERIICRLDQEWPATFSATQKRAEVLIEPGEMVELALEATPQARGRTPLPPTQVEIRFPSAWVVSRWLQDAHQTIAIYPDLQQLAEYDTLLHAHLLGQLGIHRHRQLGGGREFDQLRNYVPDDDYRQIDWKATARKQKPITVVHRTERSQNLLLCVDCGRLMGNPAGNGTYLDKATDACTLLAHVADRGGDQVGLLLFRDSVLKFLPPKHGKTAVLRIIDSLVDLDAQPVFPSFAAWAEAVQIRNRKRSMIFLFTDLGDPQLSADLVATVPVIARRHVVVVISIRNPTLDQVADGPAAERADIYRILAARTLSDERAARTRQLVQAGVQVLDVDHPSLLVKTVNKYLDIKARQLL